jgi:hypothetical protein
VQPPTPPNKARRQLVPFDDAYARAGRPTESSCTGLFQNADKCHLFRLKRRFDTLYGPAQ